MSVDMLVFFFTDIEGSTRLWEEHTGAMTGVIARHDEILRRHVEAHGGRITKHTGDGITAVFQTGHPLTCALEAQVRFAAEPWEPIGALPIRIGLHAGEAEFHLSAGTADGDYFGPPVNATARVMSAAWGGQILLTPEVTEASPLPEQATLLDLGQHLLKNVSTPQQLYQLRHPGLTRHEFPPPRTLSGQSIRQAVEEGGGQMAGLEPEAMGLAILSATLLPVLQGELDPETGALKGNLGVLKDLGAVSLGGFVAGFAERLRTGDDHTPGQTQALLQRELQIQWRAGGEAAVALRTDTSRLLQAVQGIEAAMTAASGEVREALARGLADLGEQFGEFRWMLAGVQEVLAEVRTRQALQLALQREQLDLQRQQLVKTNLILQRQHGGPVSVEVTVDGEVDEEPVADAAPAPAACPYKGLAAFEADDAAYFFGREELVAELTARLAGTRFLAVVGPSGSGKSSLVRAGLLPAVWAGALPVSEEWKTLVLTPGAHPLNELAVRLSVLSGDRPAALLRDLEADSRALELAIRQVLAEEPDEVKLLVVVDQFEEVFALCHDHAERGRFIDALLYAAGAEEGRVVVVPTIRADFYGRCADYPGLAARMGDGLLVGPMSEEELRAAIERPAVVVGLRVEPGLSDTIVADVALEPGALPLLSHALLETYERRRGRMLTLSGYTAAGGVTGSIAQTADTVYAGFLAEEQVIARSIFLRLTELGEEGTQDTRRRVTPAELVHTSEEAPAVEAVSKTLADARLITTGEDTVEVAHEALIREWPALRGWLEEDREGLRVHRHLTEAAQEWERLAREPGELYRGARLAAATEWVEGNGTSLNPLEREFLAASQELARQREAEREAALARERALERRSLQRLRVIVGVLVVASIAGIILALALLNQSRLAQTNEAVALRSAATATVSQGQALIQAGLAATSAADARAQQTVAEAEAQARATQQVLAETEAEARATAQADADAAAVEASQQRDAARASERQALEAYSLSLVANARQVLEDEDTELALLLALAANGIEDPPAAARRALMDIAYAPATRRQLVTDEANYSLDVSPDGKMLLAGSADGSVFLWELASGKLLQRLEGHTDGVIDVAFSPDGQRALSAGGDDTVLWDLASGEILDRLATPDVRTVAFSPDGGTALTGEDPGSTPGELILWDLETDDPAGRIIRRFGAREEEHRQGVRSVAFSPDGRRALVGLGANPPQDRPVVLWDLEAFKLIRFLEGPTTSVNEVVISPDGRLGLAGAASERFVSLWDLETGEELHRLEGHEGLVVGVAFSPDGQTALSTDGDGVVIWWDLESGEAIRRLRGHTDAVWDVSFVDDTHAVSSAHDGTLRLWDLTSSWQLDRWRGAEMRPGDAVTALAISPDGRLALSGTGSDNDPFADDHFLILWDYETGKPLRRLEGHKAKVSDVVFGPDGRQALSGSFDGTLILWDLESGESIQRLEGHTGGVTAIDISSDASHALSGAFDATVIYWDLASGEIVRRFTGHHVGFVSGVAFGSNDRQAVSSSYDGSLILWDVASGQRIRRLTGITSTVGGHLGPTDIEAMALSSDGRTALSAGWTDQTLILWDVASGQSIRRFDGHASSLQDVEIGPRGRIALSGGLDDNVILWDIATGTPLRRFPVTPAFEDAGSIFYGTRVVIHPDGESALSGEPDGTILKWQLAEPSPAELIAWIRENRHLGELTCLERETYQIAPFCDESGSTTASTDDLIAAAAQSAAAAGSAASPLAEPAPSPAAAPVASPTPRSTRVAVVGENRGELARYEYDVWTYEGQAGEILTLHMQADNPINPKMDCLPCGIPAMSYEEKSAAGILDPFLTVTAPDGRLLALADDGPSREDWEVGDSLIEAVYLPADGIYRIEAGSVLDDLAGGYTLTIESRPLDVDPAVLQSYDGRYEAPWGDISLVSFEDGRLDLVQWPDKYQLDPITETEFVRNPLGERVVFDVDDDGLVTSFVLINPWGHFEHVRLED